MLLHKTYEHLEKQECFPAGHSLANWSERPYNQIVIFNPAIWGYCKKTQITARATQIKDQKVLITGD
jgi:hypothetical protein